MQIKIHTQYFLNFLNKNYKYLIISNVNIIRKMTDVSKLSYQTILSLIPSLNSGIILNNIFINPIVQQILIY